MPTLSSPFLKIAVSNYDVKFLQVDLEIVTMVGYKFEELKPIIDDRLRSFLSPWIRNEDEKISIHDLIMDPDTISIASQSAKLRRSIVSFVKKKQKELKK